MPAQRTQVLILLEYHLPEIDGLELADRLHTSPLFERVSVACQFFPPLH